MNFLILNNDCIEGYILDGFPRTIPQAIGLDKILKKLSQNLDKVIVLNVDDKNIIERMSGRRVHLSSGRVYHIKHNPPKIDGYDDVTNEKLIIRKDDQKETVMNRLKIYHKTTKPLINFYGEKGIVSAINGNNSISTINNEILNIC